MLVRQSGLALEESHQGVGYWEAPPPLRSMDQRDLRARLPRASIGSSISVIHDSNEENRNSHQD